MDTDGRTENFLTEFSKHYEQIKREDGWGELLARGGSHSIADTAARIQAASGLNGSSRADINAAAAVAQFKKGDKVELHDLKAAAELNGELGRVIRYEPATKRFAIRLLHRQGKNGKAMAVRVRVGNIWRYNALQNAWRDEAGEGAGDDNENSTTDGDGDDNDVDVGEDAPIADVADLEEPLEQNGRQPHDSSNATASDAADAADGESAAATGSPLIVVNKAPRQLTIDYSRFDNLSGAETSEDEEGDDDSPARIFRRGDVPGLPAPTGSGVNAGYGGGSSDMDAAREALDLLNKIRREADEKAAERKRWRERWGD